MTSYLDGLTERDLGTLAAIVGADPDGLADERSEERRVGKEC